jgi:hypothetical protein
MVKFNPKIRKDLETFIKSFNIETDLVDLKAIFDSKLTYQENKTQIERYIKILTKPKIEEKLQEDELEEINRKLTEEEWLHMQEEVKNQFKDILKNETSDLKQYYFILEKYCETVLKSEYLHSLFITGKAGIGKTFSVQKLLSKNNSNYKTILGNISPLELYHTMYDYRKGVIVFDDTQALLKNKQSMSLLLSGLWSSIQNKRLVSWLTTSKKLKCPPQFLFEGKVFFIANEIPSDIEPIVSRCLEYRLNFTYEEILKIMAEITKLPHKNLAKEERIMILNWIRDNTDSTTVNIDLRLQSKIETLYEHNKNNWQELASKLLKKNEDFILIKQLIDGGKTVNLQVKEWIESTGKDRMTFFRLKKALLLNQSVDWGNKKYR